MIEPATYEIRVRGRLSPPVLAAFEGLVSEVEPVETVLHGPLRDQAELHGVLARIQALGLELVELRRVRGRWKRRTPRLIPVRERGGRGTREGPVRAPRCRAFHPGDSWPTSPPAVEGAQMLTAFAGRGSPMTATSSTAQSAGGNGRGDEVAWHGLAPEYACTRLGVDPRAGLSAAEVEQRRAKSGPNKLAEAPPEPGWKAFLRQYRDLMQLVLLGAAAVSIVALQEFSTGIVIIGLTVLNAVLGLNQEGKAAESVAALQKMLIIRAHARRGGELVELPSEELVPGDIVSFEAGDRIPADGRLLVAATLEIEEAALTGESTPVLKSVAAVEGEDVPLGDRLDMAYMNSTVTRGRGEMVVTATGMETEVGQISRMLSQVEQEKTPLTRQLDQLTVLITIMAGIALALVIIIGLIRGDDFDELFLIGISLAIAAIPTGLPAVVTTMLSLGTQALAAKGAIVKRLRSVETLGSTSAICSDKTGTLTLNQMTARELVVVGRRYHVEGEGYSTEGRILRVAGETDTPLDRFLLPMALANDAAVRDGEIVGDPTEAALVVLAAKGGIDVDETRRLLPRVAEVPFDSEYKLMATFHEMEDGGRKVIRCFVKGAPDVLLARSSHVAGADGEPIPMDSGEGPRPRGERPPRRRGPARARRGLARHRSGRVRPRGDPARRGAGPDAAGPRRHRRPAAQGGARRDRPVRRGRHQRAHDHRRPRDYRRGDREAARHPRPRATGHGVRGHVRRGAGRTRSRASASSPAWPPRTRCASSRRSSARATSWR